MNLQPLEVAVVTHRDAVVPPTLAITDVNVSALVVRSHTVIVVLPADGVAVLFGDTSNALDRSTVSFADLFTVVPRVHDKENN